MTTDQTDQTDTTGFISVGVDYCTAHHGIRNEDMDRCDMFDDYVADNCDLRPLGYRPAVVDPVHIDGPCPFLTCLETGPHDHPVCGAVRYGNTDCPTCRAHPLDERIPDLWRQSITPQ